MATDETTSAVNTSEPTDGTSEAVLRYLQGRWELATCGVVGVLLLGIAAYVLIRDGGDTALAALIAAGASLVILGAVGNRITSIKYKELEVRLAEAAAREVREDNPEGAEILQELRDDISSERMATRAPAETESLAKLEANLPDGIRLEPSFRIGGTEIDGRLVREHDGRTVWVEVVHGGAPLINRTVRKLTNALAAADPKPHGVVVIAAIASPSVDAKFAQGIGLPVKVLKATGPAYQYEGFVNRLFNSG